MPTTLRESSDGPTSTVLANKNLIGLCHNSAIMWTT